MKNWKVILVLAVLGLLVSGSIAIFQESPGYMDADYYFAGGLQLASGKGFNAPYIWNYLDNPESLPHPTNSYWMPLASILAAVGMKVAGQNTWFAGRLMFFLIAACIPITTYALAYSISKRKDLAFISGLLSIFGGFYAAYIPVTDTFALYMLLGGIFFLIAHRQDPWVGFSLGIIAGFMHLARADGILWLMISLLVILFKPSDNLRISRNTKRLLDGVLCIIGYLLIMGGWLLRNKFVFGSFLSPGGGEMFWLTNYNQLFSYPPGSITVGSWLKNGWLDALQIRFWALNINLQNMLASQASIFLFPLILIGIWKMKKDFRIITSVFGWMSYIIMMSFVFPFAGARGGFFHSGAALQPMWWSLAPIGLVALVEWVGKKRSWNIEVASKVFLWGTLGLAILFTGFVVFGKLFSPMNGSVIWSAEYNLYKNVNTLMDSDNLKKPTVIVTNPPGFFLATGKRAIAVPDGDADTTLLVAKKFNANYLVLEKEGFPDGLKGLYQNPDQYSGFIYLGEMEGARVFLVEP